MIFFVFCCQLNEFIYLFIYTLKTDCKLNNNLLQFYFKAFQLLKSIFFLVYWMMSSFFTLIIPTACSPALNNPGSKSSIWINQTCFVVVVFVVSVCFWGKAEGSIRQSGRTRKIQHNYSQRVQDSLILQINR